MRQKANAKHTKTYKRKENNIYRCIKVPGRAEETRAIKTVVEDKSDTNVF